MLTNDSWSKAGVQCEAGSACNGVHAHAVLNPPPKLHTRVGLLKGSGLIAKRVHFWQLTHVPLVVKF